MVKKQNLIIAITLFLLFSVTFGYTFISPKSRYLYSQFIFDQGVFVALVLFYIIAVVALLFILLLCKNSTAAKLIVLLPITLVVWWVFTAFCGLAVNNFWKSETKDFENFSEVDYSLENEISIAGLSIGDLTLCDVASVEEFLYNYQSYPLHSKFILKGRFAYTEESYNSIKQSFLSDDEFIEVKYSDVENISYDMTGYFEFENKHPEYQSKTSVVEWEKLVIRFNDETLSFYFDLSGDYDT